MKVEEASMSLLGKARTRPDQVRKVLDTVAQQGAVPAYRKVINGLDSYTPLGYSLAGVVVEAGKGAEEITAGEMVACAGNEFALHAELNWVPTSLCVPVPSRVDPRAAAFATVGAIAMQGVRQGGLQLGETACVIGLGLVGQIVVRLLVASGVRVVGIDPVPERCSLAEKAGAALCAAPDGDGAASIEREVQRSSGSLGADGVFLVAGGSTNEPVELAARLARDRATVVDIGKCRLDLPWGSYYEKELDVRFSRSYGPGRYDPSFELDGVDYPAGYVRWTERRNMACFLDLLASGDVDVEPLIAGVYPLGRAAEVYSGIRDGSIGGVGFLFSYESVAVPEPRGPAGPVIGPEAVRLVGPSLRAGPDGSGDARRDGREPGTSGAGFRAPAPRRFRRAGPGNRVSRAGPGGAGPPVRVGFVGAGNYASSMLLPHLADRNDVELSFVVTRSSLSAVNASRRFGFRAAGTDFDELLSDDRLDAVFVVTRHSSHADLACRALEAGKAVFVEKPLALDGEQLDHVLATVEATGNMRLMVGFNRRFSPIFGELRRRFGRMDAPVNARYLVNADSLGKESWYRNTRAEGSRFVGEGGHFVDSLSWWIGADPVRVSAVRADGSGGMHVSLDFEDGSFGAIDYLTGGHRRYPKETFDAHSNGKSVLLCNFRRGGVWVGRSTRRIRTLRPADKGQGRQIEAFLAAVRTSSAMPISLASLAATTRATLVAEVSASTGTPQRL
jgi:predicted dehydrogenase/threonine dehydrogenase-like Zn-dependent dehydrogenase